MGDQRLAARQHGPRAGGIRGVGVCARLGLRQGRAQGFDLRGDVRHAMEFTA
jgi:hypothetical protein